MQALTAQLHPMQSFIMSQSNKLYMFIVPSLSLSPGSYAKLMCLSHPQRTCYLHGEQDHDPSGRLHVCGQKEEEARPKTVKQHSQLRSVNA